ncbi:hypothetical protein SMKI_06G0890 [Saccharomyces mikatae IFO 1815]|uniref:Bud9p n=1 Tax=Saccharomyces mikatae IFO 1815 TaxID=226126 RepID=A0AA35IYU8_SACMI|nr:uncharacterized protein SMKI_06G0890 [Saccharomyces mikatae IFO 1815]CAI4038742.1 hypothetical protein SMKI_06G0890 [Saccharomyces mikatae IFO 1815]
MTKITRNASSTTDNSTSTSGTTTTSCASLNRNNLQRFNQSRGRIRSDSLFIEGSDPSPPLQAESYNVYIDGSKYSEILKRDTNSSSPDSRQVFEDARTDNFYEKSHSVLENSILDLIRRDSATAASPIPPPCSNEKNRNSSNGSSAETNPHGHSSSGTISTSVLLNMSSTEKHIGMTRRECLESSSMKSFEKLRVRPSSSYYPPLEGTPPCQGPRNTVSKRKATSQVQDTYSPSYIPYGNGLIPCNEETIEVVKSRVPNDEISDAFDKAFIPHEFQIPKKAWNRPSANRFSKLQSPRNHSLLTDILKPVAAADSACNQGNPSIVLEDTVHPSALYDSFKESLQTGLQDQRQKKSNQLSLEKTCSPRVPLEIAKDSMRSQNLSYEKEHQNNAEGKQVPEVNTENNAIKQCQYVKIHEKTNQDRQLSFQMNTMPIQRIDSSSIRSYDSQLYGFSEVYSIPRVTLALCVCLLIPPLFFFFSVSGGSGISNYRLMRMIMNYEHRIGLLKGFEWDIDVHWFRTLCFVLGCIEISVIFASIGIGFGVGMTRE